MIKVSFEEVAALVGQEVGVGEWLEVTQERIDRFAEATGDYQWIHVDVERAEREFGGTIAHGYLTLSLVPTLSAGLLVIEGSSRTLNYGLDKVRFLQPVRTGARLRVRQRLTGAEPKSGGMLLRREYTVEIKGSDRPACIVEGLVVVFP